MDEEELSDEQLQQLLKHAEQRLRAAEGKTGAKGISSSTRTNAKVTAGSDWFNLPRTNLTPELKRDLQLLKMRSVLDPKRFYKKDNSKLQIPKYSEVGTIIEGPTEYFTSRLTNKERKRTLVEEVLQDEQSTKRFKSNHRLESVTFVVAGDVSCNSPCWLSSRTPYCPRLFIKIKSTQCTFPQAQTWMLFLTQIRVQQPPLEHPLGRDLAQIGPNKSIDPPPDFRLPRSVQAVYLKPLRREAPYGVPVCDLQLRSYSVRNLEFFSDFCLRAAYYLGLPAFGPIPLPRITERWTVPRSSFIYKKSQENFERRTVRRLIQIKDGNPETVQIWLAFVKKHAYYGIGMKANVWEFSKLDGEDEGECEYDLGSEQIIELVNTENFRSATHGNAPYSKTPIPLQTVIFSGIQPTGIPHLGNYLGALQQWKKLQDEAHPTTKLFFCVVDLHAITTPQDPVVLRRRRREMMAALLAVGIRPERSTVFCQSEVPAHSELMWILSCTSSMGYLSRMTQWKVATHVPVGEDQSQHLEFAREQVTNFNYNYKSCLVPPRTIMSPAKRVMSLQEPTKKMSKSDPNDRSRILITDSLPTIRKNIMGAITDSLSETVSYNPIHRPGVVNLLELLSHFDSGGRSMKELAEVHDGMKLVKLKQMLVGAVDEGLGGIREEYERVLGEGERRWGSKGKRSVGLSGGYV
ncbi:hypothetical protein BJ875DRAFT_506545 [Amylocarpus encephaloides]|uniref:Small ribosomal subunit protein uS10m n=1 Tax=Amylocarpus encephaloides TaxID=45428 RepID=A0A9P7YE14_9HELO|nr:hypothetical protein BJ875DRAFT_506545 [Amylocarpus encephaloides]